MADFTHSKYSSSFSLLLILFSSLTLTLILIAKPVCSSKIPNFDSEFTVYGDVERVSGGNGDGDAHVMLTRPSGLLLRRKPFRLLEPTKPTSFSTDFTFSVSAGDGDGDGNGKAIAVVLVPADFASRVSGEKKFVVAVVNASSTDLRIKNGEKLRSWIDYDSSSKRLEVRLAKFGESRPYNPKIAYAVDLSSIWRDQDVLVGISSSSSPSSSTEDSPWIITVYSWNFRLRNIPNSIHSLPADPRGYKQHLGDHQKRGVCPLAVLGGLIFATVCGALMAFAVLFLWAVVAANKHTVFHGEGDHQTHVKSMGYRYEKIGVVVEKDSDNVVKN